jgi:hypothetical protein
MSKKHAVIPLYGELAFSGITGSYATLLTPLNDPMVVMFFNSLDKAIIISLNAGITDQFKIPASQSFVLDLRANDILVEAGKAFMVKHAGSAPTSGFISCTVVY